MGKNREVPASLGLSFPERLWQDVRYGARTLLKNRGFAAIAIVSLGLGIGATTAIFSIFDTIWLRPLPYENAGRLVAVSEVQLDDPGNTMGVALANYFDWKEQCKTFDHLALAHLYWPLTLVGGDRPERIIARRVTEGYLDIFGAKANLGRLFVAEEFALNGPPVIVLGYPLWQRLFGSDPGVLGRQLGLERDTYTVVGVMSPNFQELYGEDVDLWMPINWRMKQRSARYFPVIGRLSEGTDLRAAQAELDVVGRRLAEQYPAQKGFGVRVEPLRDYMYGYWGRRFLVFFGAVVFVLLIACANVANLLLVRAASRDKEMAIRASVGAGRRRLIRQVLTEGVLLAGLGAAFGLVIALIGVRLLAGIDPGSVPRASEIGLSLRILGFTVVAALLSGLLFSLAPALAGSKPNLNESLKETGRRAASRFGGHRAQGALVIVEIALSLVLLIGAGLMLHNVWRTLHTDVGFNTENLTTMQITLPMFQYMVDDGKGRELTPRAALVRQRIQEELRALPGVRSVSVATSPPLSGCLSRYLSVGSQPPPPPGRDAPWVCLHPVTTEYLQTLEIPLLRGRGFTEHDNESSPPVAIISESLVRRYFPNNEEPIGRIINLGRWDLQGNREPPLQIVGVVPDVRQNLTRQPFPAVYMPYSQLPARFGGPNTTERTVMAYIVRTAIDAGSLEPSMRRVVAEEARDVPVLGVQTIDDVKSRYLQRTLLYTWLLAIFAGIAVILAAVGVFGVMSYAVTRRTRELGIRMALGAQPGAVLKLVMGQGLLMVLAGVAIGLAGAFGLTRFLASLLFEVKPTEPSTFVAVSLLLCAVGLAACAIPAWRAARVSPTRSLRHE